MAGFSYRPSADLIPLPKGSELFVLPGRLPVACDPETAEPLLVEDNPFKPGDPVQAVAAFMAPAHTAIFTSAYQSTGRCSPSASLRLYGRGLEPGRFWVAAFRSDLDRRQDSDQYKQQPSNGKRHASCRNTPTTGSSSIWANVV